GAGGGGGRGRTGWGSAGRAAARGPPALGWSAAAPSAFATPDPVRRGRRQDSRRPRAARGLKKTSTSPACSLLLHVRSAPVVPEGPSAIRGDGRAGCWAPGGRPRGDRRPAQKSSWTGLPLSSTRY